MRTISIIKEKKDKEKRVILLPKDINELSKKFSIIVETGAGEGIGISDSEYEKNGAIICSTEDAWNKSDLVLKYKAPENHEYKFFREGLNIASLFHAEGDYELMKELKSKRTTAYSYEFFRDKNGIYPMAIPGGEIAGKLAVLYSAFLLQSNYGGKGKLLPSIRGAEKTTVAIIGHGNVGGSAIKLCCDLGCDVVVFGKNSNKMLKELSHINNNIQFVEISEENLIKILPTVDILIGAILISTYNTKPIVTKELMKLMQKGSVVIDVTCGYGEGYLPFINRNTTLDSPAYINDDGIICCKIDNLPSSVPITTTEAYSNNAKEWLFKLANHVLCNFYDDTIETGKIIDNGKIVHEVIQEHWDYYEGLVK